MTAAAPTLTIEISGMSCASCVGRVERTIAAMPGVQTASVNLATDSATVTYFDDVVTPQQIATGISEAGYAASVATAGTPSKRGDKAADEASVAWRRFRTAGALTLPVFLLEMGGHAFPAFHMWIGATIGHTASWVLQWVLTTIILVGPGRVFFIKGVPSLLRRAPDMNSLVALGAGAAYLYSAIATALPSLLPDIARAVYFEAAAVIVTLILLGRFLEARAKGQTGAAIRGLMDLQVRDARMLRDGGTMTLPIDDLAVGDVVVVRPGERVAIDGTIENGTSFIDESMITGEPVPVEKTAGDAVTGGTINGAGALEIRATRVGADTALAQIIRMVQEAQGAKLPIQALVDRVTMWFVPAVMGVALVTVLVWLAVGPAPALTFALVSGVSVLIVACPCAMGLATPTSIMVGSGRAAELGVLFRKGDALQGLGNVRVVAFDKTGTLTAGRPELTDMIVADGLSRAEALPAVAAVEALSEHPIAEAIVRAASSKGCALPKAQDFAASPGFGARATVDGRNVLVGAARFMATEGIDISGFTADGARLSDQGRTVVFAAIDGKAAALIAVSDPIKPTSPAAVAALKAQGLHVALITGDGHGPASVIARQCGIDHVLADVLPAEKVDAVQSLRDAHGPVAFVGDGINDAPALATADVGVAIGTGTDIAIEAADVVLMSGDPMAVVTALEASRKTMANIRQNLIWAFAYNIALIPVAAGILYPLTGTLLSPVFAAAAMALSSVSVLGNALRLRRIATATVGEAA